jgi:capping protein beta
LSDFNRDGDSYRSPWSNEYHPPLSEERSNAPFTPSANLRSLEVHANQVWDVYRKLYYGTEAVSSVYLWDQDKPTTARGGGGFAGTFLIQKQLKDQAIIGNQSTLSGYWNSIHVMDVTPMSSGTSKFKYRLTTTILLSLKINQSSQLTLGGSLTKQTETTESIQSSITDHMGNIGPMLERVETEMRSNMDALYLQKTKDVVTYLRSTGLEREREGLMATLMKQNSIGSAVVRQEEGMKDVLKARLSKMNESS